MKKITRSLKLSFFFTLTFFAQAVSAQLCFPDGIQFTTQGQVDSFSINYPNCDSIEGALQIGPNTSISNLLGLQDIKSIGGLDIIQNSALTSLQGLENIHSINGNITIWVNNSLTSLVGLDNLESIDGSVWISSNASLTSLHGLNRLKSINDDIEISYNDSLTSFEGLDSLSSINGDFLILGNSSLSTLGSLQELSTLSGRLSIIGNPITSLSELHNLHKIGTILQLDNTHLTSLEGLENLDTIGPLMLSFNSELTSLTALSNLTSIGGFIRIYNNVSLPSLAGLENINPNSIQTYDDVLEITIAYNLNLSVCNLSPICTILQDSTKSSYIAFNATGCATKEEIDCSDIFVNTQEANPILLTIHPNPASTFVNIKTNKAITNVRVMSQLGKAFILPFSQIDSKSIELNIEHLQSGFYLVEVLTNEGRTIGKLIVK